MRGCSIDHTLRPNVGRWTFWLGPIPEPVIVTLTWSRRVIPAGKPIQNAFIESLNGKLRDECLNEQAFASIDEARETISAWYDDYNSVRPNAALDNRTPLEFALAALTQNPQVCPL